MNFNDVVVMPLRRYCSKTLDWKIALPGLLPFFSAARLASRSYAKHLCGMKNGRGATLADLPKRGEGPDFVFYTTCLQTGSSFRFTREGLHDWKLGTLRQLDLPLAVAISASAAFPPFLAPLELRTDPTKWIRKPQVLGLDHAERIRAKLVLVDGGVYDNMGIEALWRTMQCVLVSDAGAPFEFATPGHNWLGQLRRVRDILVQQTRALRKRMLMADFNAVPEPRYAGAYWGIGTQIENYALETRLCRDSEVTHALQRVSTRLKALNSITQERLINWGYALADAAIRTHVDPSASMGRLPYPNNAF